MVPKIEETDAAFEFEHSEGMAEHQSDLPKHATCLQANVVAAHINGSSIG